MIVYRTRQFGSLGRNADRFLNKNNHAIFLGGLGGVNGLRVGGIKGAAVGAAVSGGLGHLLDRKHNKKAYVIHSISLKTGKPRKPKLYKGTMAKNVAVSKFKTFFGKSRKITKIEGPMDMDKALDIVNKSK